MIAHILLVAAREFRQIAATRGFWITLLILPLALAVGPLTSRFLGDSDTETVMLIGGDTAAIRSRIELDEQRRVLTALSRYAQRYDLDRASPGALWAQHDRWYGDADVAAFARAGGADKALATMKPAITPDTPAFEAPEAWYEVVPTPAEVAAATPAKLDAVVRSYLSPPDGSDRKRIDYAVHVPAGFGSTGNAVRLWANGPPKTGLMQLLQDVLTRDLRTRYLEASGLDAARASAASSVAPVIEVSTPPPGDGGRERVVIRSILPLASAYILLMSLMLSGSWMLQGLVEERSNKLMETVLACVSPNELMYGKLVGTVAVGLTMVLVWVLCGIGAAFATHGVVAEFLRPALAPLAAPGVALAMIYFFIAGYLMISMLFLAIGAMSDSMRDAQSYLTPVILVIAMPFALLAQAILRDTGGLAVTVMTWIPIYTPFTMLARLGVGVPLWEVVATGALLAGFIALEIVFLGRVFRASLLSAGEKMNLARIGRLMRAEA
jgi:ABC-2 type transport system permease protein